MFTFNCVIVRAYVCACGCVSDKRISRKVALDLGSVHMHYSRIMILVLKHIGRGVYRNHPFH